MAKINLNSAAIAAIASLSIKDKRSIDRSIEKIAKQDIKSLFLTHNIQKLIGEKKYYTFRASPDLRIVFEIEKEDNISVLDVVRHSTIKGIMKSKSQ